MGANKMKPTKKPTPKMGPIGTPPPMPESPMLELPVPSQATIDANSTKGRMGEGKPPSPAVILSKAAKAGAKLYDSVKDIVVNSMAKTIEVKESNKKRVQTIKQPKPGANPSEILRKKK